LNFERFRGCWLKTRLITSKCENWEDRKKNTRLSEMINDGVRKKDWSKDTLGSERGLVGQWKAMTLL